MSKKSKLKDLQKAFKDADSAPGREALPENTYTVRVAKARIRNHEYWPGKPLCMTWHLEVIDGEYTGRMIFKDTGLEGEYASNNLAIVKSDFTAVGLKDEAEEDLEDACSKALDRVLTVRLRAKKGRPDLRNIFFVGLVDAPVQKALAEMEEAEEEEEKPQRRRKPRKPAAPKPEKSEKDEDDFFDDFDID